MDSQNFVQTVLGVLEETDLDPSKIELEITESILMESWNVIRSKLDVLRARGIGVALDDFGKGYSSLSYLEQLPITILKIDKIFIDGIHEADRDVNITGNIVKIGKKLGLTVIAEGVETDTQLTYLANQQCDRMQGWLFSKALPEQEAVELTRKNLG
jgi:EAL domain-containing protein (putative c-di-GMP-specific phosphodiesterase class I)